jgi:large subunit ribosomal protein L15
MKNLGNISPSKGSNKSKKRLGRGLGSNWGKTAGKGHKGQTARKGGTVAPGFEGGQTPLYRRLPKRGFKNHFRREYAAINIDILNRFDGKINPETLLAAGLIAKGQLVKILGRGNIERKLELSVHKVSESAKSAIEKAGGSVALIDHIPPKKVKWEKKKRDDQK